MAVSGVIPGGDAPALTAASVSPSNTVDLAPWARALWIGGAGDLRVIMAGDNTNTPIVFPGLSAGVWMPIQVKRVMATGTTATNIIAVN